MLLVENPTKELILSSALKLKKKFKFKLLVTMGEEEWSISKISKIIFSNAKTEEVYITGAGDTVWQRYVLHKKRSFN